MVVAEAIEGHVTNTHYLKTPKTMNAGSLPERPDWVYVICFAIHLGMNAVGVRKKSWCTCLG